MTIAEDMLKYSSPEAPLKSYKKSYDDNQYGKRIDNAISFILICDRSWHTSRIVMALSPSEAFLKETVI